MSTYVFMEKKNKKNINIFWLKKKCDFSGVNVFHWDYSGV